VSIKQYATDPHLTFTHNKGATARSRSVGQVINHLAATPDPDATFVAIHDGPGDGDIYLGTDTQGSLTKFEEERLPGVRKVLGAAGVERDLYLEFGMQSPTGNKKTGGFYSDVAAVRGLKPHHAVGLGKDHANGYTALHELVHAIRHERGWARTIRRMNPYEEVDTCLETIGVMEPQTLDEMIRDFEGGQRGAVGYYQIFTDPVGAILYDRVLMTGSVGRALTIDEAHERAQDRGIRSKSNIREWPSYAATRYGKVAPKVLPAGAARRARPQRVVAIRVSTRPRSVRLAKGAGLRLFHALLHGKEVVVHVTTAQGVTKAEVLAYITRRLGADRVWECRGCRKVRVA
jgi:hypothetical protein